MANEQPTSVTEREIQLPDVLLEARKDLGIVISEKLGVLNEMEFVEHTNPNITHRQLSTAKAKIIESIQEDNPSGYKAMSIHSEVLKVKQTIELIETQCSSTVVQYYDQQRAEVEDTSKSNPPKATQRFVTNDTVKKAIKRVRDFADPHPKHSEIRVLVAQFLGINNGERITIISESPDTVESLTSFLSNNFEVEQLVDGKDTDNLNGAYSTGRFELLEGFDNGDFEVLVTTPTVAKQHTIPESDITIFYEPNSTEILSTNDQNAAHLKEVEKVVLTTDPPLLPSQSKVENKGQNPEDSDSENPTSNQVEIRVDQNNHNQTITANFADIEFITAQFDELQYCDYIISDRICIIHRTTKEFQNILLGKSESFFTAVGNSNSMYEEQVLIVEGEDLYEHPKIEPQAIRAAIGALMIDFNAKVLRTEDESDTAGMLKAVASRDQTTKG